VKPVAARALPGSWTNTSCNGAERQAALQGCVSRRMTERHALREPLGTVISRRLIAPCKDAKCARAGASHLRRPRFEKTPSRSQLLKCVTGMICSCYVLIKSTKCKKSQPESE